MAKRVKKEVHASDLRTFKKCRVLWNFTSPLRMYLELDFPPLFFFLGEGVHAAFEQYYRTNTDLVLVFKLWYWYRKYLWDEAGYTLSETQTAKYHDQYKLGLGMLQHYKLYYPRDKEPFEVLRTETKFVAPIRSPRSGRASSYFYAAGTFDGLIMLEDGSYWVLEHKTYASVRGPEQFTMDDQTKTYAAIAAELYDLPIAGIYYNILRKKLPTIPRLLKNGGLSQAMAIDTTYQVYLRTLQHYHLDPHAYTDILTRLATKGNTFFYRFPIHKQAAELKTHRRLLYQTARKMCSKNVSLYPLNDDWQCARCWFREPCLMILQGYPNAAKSWLAINCRPRKARESFDYDRALTLYRDYRRAQQQAVAPGVTSAD